MIRWMETGPFVVGETEEVGRNCGALSASLIIQVFYPDISLLVFTDKIN